MNREIKYKLYQGSELIGIERVVDGNWQWMAYAINPDKGERWTRGVFPYTENGIKRCSFTGLKDKNGVEIYEGDILKGYAPYEGEDNEQVMEVRWHEAGGWVINWDSGFNGGESDLTLYGWALYEDYQFEVIGNINQHPHLISSHE